MSAIKLEPCPFCGEHLKEISDGYFQHSVNSCFFEAWEYDFGGSPSMVLDWNRRAQPAEEVQKDALKEADALISRIEAFYDGADMFAWAKVREKVRAALAAKDTP